MELSAFDLSGKVALVTGGAHGIGFSIAEGMAHCGAKICFNCSSESSYEKGMAAYKAAGIDAHGYIADVTDWDAVKAMVDKIAAEVGPVDILVNNAGIIQRKPMLETSTEDSEFGQYNIQCNGMGPGYIATPQTAPLRERRPDGSRSPFDAFIISKTPAGRWGEAEDMVGPCVFLASRASDFVNGQILYADGGILAYLGHQPQ